MFRSRAHCTPLIQRSTSALTSVGNESVKRSPNLPEVTRAVCRHHLAVDLSSQIVDCHQKGFDARLSFLPTPHLYNHGTLCRGAGGKRSVLSFLVAL